MFSITHAHFLLVLSICLFVLWVKGIRNSFDPKANFIFSFVLTQKVFWFFFLSGFVLQSNAVSVHLINRDRYYGFILSLC